MVLETMVIVVSAALLVAQIEVMLKMMVPIGGADHEQADEVVVAVIVVDVNLVDMLPMCSAAFKVVARSTGNS